MEKILEALLKLPPFAAWFGRFGEGKDIAIAITIFVVLAALVFLGKLVIYCWNRHHYCRAAQNLSPWFDYRKVKQSRELYIPTQFQNQSPIREEEPAFSHKFVSKSLLIPFFMKTAFNEKKESDKFYLVLADSGMGKTTFMINLYLRYTSFFNFGKKYHIRLLPFGDSRILDKIREIEKKEIPSTILLLDAFDEYKQLLPPDEPDGLTGDERFRLRLDELLEAVRDFREVIITSRTQYFPGQEDQPYELKIPRFDEKGFHKLAKFYLSPFHDREIKHYLDRKYGFIWNRKKKRNALAVIKNVPKLMVRPMLLGYIDLLVDSNRTFGTTFQIYDTLIAKWIEREADKRKHKTEDREKFKRDLYNYSQLVALAIYQQRKQGDMFFLERESALQVATNHCINLKDYEITGQSLLTRDSMGNWKFAHKSILEFFIAKEAIRDIQFLTGIDFTGLDVALQFCSEVTPVFVLIKGGRFRMGSMLGEKNREYNEEEHKVRVDGFYMSKYLITVMLFEFFVLENSYVTDAEKTGFSVVRDGKKWNKKKGVNWRHDGHGAEQKDKRHPVIHVSWNDAIEYCTWLSGRYSATVRLPTEAEWEYACRAGTATPFNTGNNLTTDQANYEGNFPNADNPKGKFINATTPVGVYPPNAWGLHDMHGNVWEWCMDWYGVKYYNECRELGVVENPRGSESGSGRVVRGGSWYDFARRCRCASRDCAPPDACISRVGFRVVFVPQSVGSSSFLPMSKG